MKNSPIRLVYYFILTAYITLSSACGGGSGDGSNNITSDPSFSGNTNPAAIDISNAKAIGQAAGEGVQKASASSQLPTSITINNGAIIDLTLLNNIVLSTANILTLPTGAEIVPGFCSNEPSGSVSVSDANPPTSGPVILTLVYSNCTVINTDMTADGTAIIDFNDINNLDAGYTFTYIDFTITADFTANEPGGSITINSTIECENATTCTFFVDFLGSDGVTHRISDFSLTGDTTNGYSGIATFFHGIFGKVSISVNNITHGDCNSIPDAGDISFTSSNGSSGTILFDSGCTSSGTWTNTTGSGSF